MAPRTEPEAARVGEPDSLRLLLVEDNPDDAVLVSEQLRGVGEFEFAITPVDRLGNVEQALGQRTFDLILLDLSLPDSQGLDTLRQVRTLAPELPIVVLSGLDDESLALMAVREGAQDYIVKGRVESRSLGRMVRQAVERHLRMADMSLAQRQAYYFATHDPLTRLANRQQFYDVLARSVARAERQEATLAVLFLDLDGFKAVNDSLGHEVGDRLLQAVASRLRRCVRKSDTAARLGGDEFVVLLESARGATDAALFARRVIQEVASLRLIGGPEVSITASVGVALYPCDGETAEALVRNADAAMYRSKAQGKPSYTFYNFDMNQESLERLALEKSVLETVQRGPLPVLFEPRVDVEAGGIVGSEATVVWSPAKGSDPGSTDFLVIAEESSAAFELGRRLVRAASEQNVAWQRAGLRRIRVAVGLSARQFRSRDLVSAIGRILEETGLDGEDLELEIAESSFSETASGARDTIEGMKNLGVRVCVKDFEGRYLSFQSLRALPVDSVKIPRSLIASVDGERDASVLPAVLAMLESVKRPVVATGVETQEQVRFLMARGCRIMQGPVFGPPMPPREFERLLVQGRPGRGGSGSTPSSDP